MTVSQLQFVAISGRRHQQIQNISLSVIHRLLYISHQQSVNIIYSIQHLHISVSVLKERQHTIFAHICLRQVFISSQKPNRSQGSGSVFNIYQCSIYTSTSTLSKEQSLIYSMISIQPWSLRSSQLVAAAPIAVTITAFNIYIQLDLIRSKLFLH